MIRYSRNKLIELLANFMAEASGRVTREGACWIAENGAKFSLVKMTETQAAALDSAARKFAYPDA